MKKLLFLGLFVALFAACTAGKLARQNPAAPGFNTAESDAKAIAIADQVMHAMGGRKAWDETCGVAWTFFNRRKLVWDKAAGVCQIEWLNRPLTVSVDLNTGKGKVLMDGVAQTEPDTLAKYLDMGKKVWINDAYWLFMPFKLKDSGVTLKYVGKGKTDAGEAADVLQMTFSGVGVTPENKYHVWVDEKSHLVTQWAYFPKFSDEKPALQNPWGDYARYGKILLSGTRGKMGGMLPIRVLE